MITRLPLDTILLPVLLSLIVQLTYIYVDLGFGVVQSGGKTPFEAFPVLFKQNWILHGFPIVFFVYYITVQFIALWFGLMAGIAVIDQIKWLFVFFRNRKNVFTGDLKYKEADVWIYKTNKSISGIPWLAMALSLNGFTYRSQIKNISTFNYDCFILFAIILLILSVCIKASLILTKEKYLSDHLDKDPNTTVIGSLFSTATIILSSIVRALPSWGMLAAALGIASNFPALGSMERVRFIYGSLAPIIEGFFGFAHF